MEGALPDVTFPTKIRFFSRRAAASAQNSAAPPAMPLNLRSIMSSARLFPGDLVNHRNDQGAALLLDDAEP
jgi:hypothetical protein